MPGIFLESLHIPGIFAGIQVFFRVSGDFAPWTPILVLNIGRFFHIVAVYRRAREVHIATISIFRKSQVFFRGNYFFQVLALLSVYAGSHPPGAIGKLPEIFGTLPIVPHLPLISPEYNQT